MYFLWLKDKVTMPEVDGPVLPPSGRSIDDVMDMVETMQEWEDAGRRLSRRRERGED